MGSIILLFPGQGSQKVGMGKDLADAFPSARAVFEEVDEALGFDLSRICFDGPADELTGTLVAQPALFTHGAAAWAVVREALGSDVVAAAGHSLGEFTAYHSAGSLSLSEGAVLVRRRGEIMYEVGTSRPGAMAAILGNTTRPIEQICEDVSGENGTVVAANYNSDGQTVISGDAMAVEAAMKAAKEEGAKRAIRLVVSGAFHSPLMEPAVSGLEQAIDRVQFQDPEFPIFSNVTEKPVVSASVAGDLLVRQLTSPVRWVGLVKEMAEAYPDATYVELGPGNVLSGLVSRIVPGAKTVSCGTPEDVEKLMLAFA